MPRKAGKPIAGQDKAHLLRYVKDSDGTRRYTLKTELDGEPTLSAHPAGFNPEDPYVGERYAFKARMGLVPTKEQRAQKESKEKGEQLKETSQTELMNCATNNKAGVLAYIARRNYLEIYIEGLLGDDPATILQLPDSHGSVNNLCQVIQSNHNNRRIPEPDYPFHTADSLAKEKDWERSMS